MRLPTVNVLLLGLSFLELGNSLPGAAPAAASITLAPKLLPQKRKADVVSITCDSTICSAFDVSSSFLTTFDPALLTSSTTCEGTGCPPFSLPPPSPTGVSIGTDSSSAADSSASSAPFANDTTSLSNPVGPTGGTAVSSSVNNTAQITSTLTLNTTTVTRSSQWSAWTAWPSVTGSPQNATNSSATYLPDPNSQEPSFKSTATFVFPGTTIVLPIPASFPSNLPSTNASTTANHANATTTSAPTEPYASSTCYQNKKTSGTIVRASSVCYTVSCDVSSSCTDILTAYPVVTSTINDTIANNTRGPTIPTPLYNTDTPPTYPTDSVSATASASNTTPVSLTTPTATSTPLSTTLAPSSSTTSITSSTSLDSSQTTSETPTTSSTSSSTTTSSDLVTSLPNSSSTSQSTTTTTSSTPNAARQPGAFTSASPTTSALINDDPIQTTTSTDPATATYPFLYPTDDNGNSFEPANMRSKNKRLAVKARLAEVELEKKAPRPEQKYDGILQKRSMEQKQNGADRQTCCTGVVHCFFAGGMRC